MDKFRGFRAIQTHKTSFVPLPRIFDLFVDDRTSQAARIIISFRRCLTRMRGVNTGGSPSGVPPDALTMTEMRWGRKMERNT